MTNRLPLRERQEQVHELLQPDEIRRHRIAEGLEITENQVLDIHEKAKAAAIFANRLSKLSSAALRLDALDQESRTIRALLDTEPLFQARKRGELPDEDLPDATITKVDLVMTPNGFSIVEIEPGKVRGLGYGRMVREQATTSVGVSSENGLRTLINEQDTMIALSEHDRFHIPELRILGRFVNKLCIENQPDLVEAEARQAILASPLKGKAGRSIEEAMRQRTVIVSDRRPDLESKGALALVHNTGENEKIEERLRTVLSEDELNTLRSVSPATHHTLLLTPKQRQELQTDLLLNDTKLFAKPMTDAGTRGMITPDNIEALGSLLPQKQAKAFVFQEAEEIVPQRMESIDVITGEPGVGDMNVRVTLHVDKDGEIIEASVVGSPHEHLAHGGKTSVITNLEVV